MTVLEGDTGDDATLSLGPGCPVGVGITGVKDLFGVRAGGQNLPAVAKF